MPYLQLLRHGTLTSTEYLFIKLILKPLWFYATIKHMKKSTYFLSQTPSEHFSWHLGNLSNPIAFLLLFRIFHQKNENKSTTNLHGKSTQILDVNLQFAVTKRAKDTTPVPHSIFLRGKLFPQSSVFFVNSFLTAEVESFGFSASSFVCIIVFSSVPPLSAKEKCPLTSVVRQLLLWFRENYLYGSFRDPQYF